MIKEIKIEGIHRIEGHMDIRVYIKDPENVVVRAAAKEGTRILSRILVGRDYQEIPEITSRMCGVCSVIHKLAAVQAIENAFDITLTNELKILRELVAIGGHLQSHILHLHFFVLPDIMKLSSVLELLKDKETLVKEIIKIKRFANEIVERLAGSSVHPITPVVGGFTKIPSRKSLLVVKEIIAEMKNRVMEACRPFLETKWDGFDVQNVFVALKSDKGVPLLDGKVAISTGLEFDKEHYAEYISAILEDYSTALHYKLRSENRSYMVGALARLNINYENLDDETRLVCREYNIRFPVNSPLMNNACQALEMIHFLNKAENLISELLERTLSLSKVDYRIKPSNGIAVVEAPRGLLIHHYKINEHGKITYSNIITPTAQNLKNIEENIKAFLIEALNEGKKENLELEVEKIVRAYDPCISCAARFYHESQV